MLYIFVAKIPIEADSLEEAENIYAQGDWVIEDHEFYAYDEYNNSVNE